MATDKKSEDKVNLGTDPEPREFGVNIEGQIYPVVAKDATDAAAKARKLHDKGSEA